MTFIKFLLELMMISMFLTGAVVLGDVFDGVHMLRGVFAENLVEI